MLDSLKKNPIISSVALILLISIWFAWPCKKGMAQESDRHFSQDSEVFIAEIADLLQNTGNRSLRRDARDLMNELAPVWNQGRFNLAEKEGIKQLANLMQEKNVRAFPGFYDYFYVVRLLANSRQLPASITAWHRYMIHLMQENETRRFDAFIDFTIQLLEQEQISKRSVMTWYARDARFSFSYDTHIQVDFERLRLVCASRRDSAVIHQTKGVYLPEDQLWKGEGGELYWWRFEMDEDKVFVRFPGYEIDVSQPEFTVDSAVFYNRNYFDIPILGHFHEKVFSSPPGNRTSYPRFSSYYDNFRLPNVFQGIDYEGGISMRGQNLIGEAAEGRLARIEVHSQDTVFASIRSESVVISRERLMADRAVVSFYMENDSLHHPGLRMLFTNSNRTLMLLRSSQGVANAPFYGFYHKLNFYVESLYWNIDTPEIVFRRMEGPGRESVAEFESVNYYYDPDFAALQGIDEIHPMYVIQNYLAQYDGMEIIHVADLAHYMQKPEEQVIAQLLRLASRAYVVYNSIGKTATITDRFRHILNARAGDIDYDIIRFSSTTTGRTPNAMLNTQTFDLQINGVSEVELSSLRKVKLFPDNGQIQLKKNRDFFFTGLVRAGLFDFYAGESQFVYDSFKLSMTHVDSLIFYVPDRNRPKDATRFRIFQVQNHIADLNGVLYIDDPDNKSGRDEFPLYPLFTSRDESYVYFDKPFIQSGTLEREDFFFVVDPFTIDSLDNLNTTRWEFDGYLRSAGIFPLFREPLIVMEDYSLGFDHQLPDDGYEMFGGLADYNQHIHLSNEGFYGRGSIDYLSSTAQSEQFVFYPDSVTALLQTFQMQEQIADVSFPRSQGESLDMLWLADTNLMKLYTRELPLLVYNNAEFSGMATVSPEGMDGSGLFIFGDAQIASDWFDFRHISFTADTADFRLLTAVQQQEAFLASRYQAAVDFEDYQGTFRYIDAESQLAFPFNQYICTLDEAIWFMQEDLLRLNNNQVRDDYGLDTLNYHQLMDIDLSGSEFTSTHPEQESLSFFSLTAEYHLRDYAIRAEDVKILRVADAAVFPGDGLITIYENARMEPLSNAVIIADTASRHHQLSAANVSIFSKSNFSGNGIYDYYDESGSLQHIEFASIRVENNRTVASGIIPEEAGFMLSPHFSFMGRVELVAERKTLEFNGGYRIYNTCLSGSQPWTAFEALLDPEEIRMPIESNSRDLGGLQLATGFFHNRDQDLVYALLQDYRINQADHALYSPEGALWFNQESNAFEVITESVQGPRSALRLGLERCIMHASGELDLGLVTPFMNLTVIGRLEHRLIPDSTYMNTLIAMDFPFSNELMALFGDSLVVAGTPGLNLNRGNYLPAMAMVLPQEQTGLMRNDITLYGAPRSVPEIINKTITISDLRMQWFPETRSFVSIGQIGISNLGQNQVNKFVDGYVEIEKLRNRHSITLYLQLGNGQWYFFAYSGGIMQALSSSREFNEALLAIDQPNRVFKNRETGETYEYVISTRRRVTDFIRKMQAVDF